MKVITYGTFDLFHYGHWNLLKRARELGDYLVVGVSTDECARDKGKITYLPTEKRMQIVSSLSFVDEVIPEHNMMQKVNDVREKGIGIFVLGDDYKDVFDKTAEYKQLIDLGCQVVYLPRTPAVSTSELKQKMAEQAALNNTGKQ